jgi:hypothetical protein
VDALPAAGPDPQQLPELRRVPYGLHAVLELHLAQETELYMTLADSGAPASSQGRPAPRTVEPPVGFEPTTSRLEGGCSVH